MAKVSEPPALRYAIAAWIVTAGLLVMTLHLRLLPALLAGLLVYELVHVIAPRLPLTRTRGGKLAAVTLLAIAVVSALVLLMLAIIAFVQSDAGSLSRLLQKMAEIIEGSRSKLPAWLVGNLPADTDELRVVMITWLREHSGELRVVGGEVGHVIAHVLIGMIIGAMCSLHEAGEVRSDNPPGPNVAGFQGVFSAVRGAGVYNFSAMVLMPTGSGAASINFETAASEAFLHVDFMPDNRVRMDDLPATEFGSFPRDLPFLVTVTLNINVPSTVHIALSGGASGARDYTIAPPFQHLAPQFGAIRVWQGFGQSGPFDVTNIVVTYSTN